MAVSLAMTHRHRGNWWVAVGLGALLEVGLIWADPKVWRAVGSEVPQFNALDKTMERFMASNRVSAAAVAVTRHGRLVYAKGFTWAVDQCADVEPESGFRIASLSKPITAVAVLRLVEEKRLSLDDTAARWVDLSGAPGTERDSRLDRVTIRQLLHHTGGWDRNRSFDPMFRDEEIADELGIPLPVLTSHIIRFMGARSLDRDPGTKYCYSNYGYCLLGRIIEACTGTSYADYVRQAVLDPLKMTHTFPGRSSREGRLPQEVEYDSDSEPPYDSFRLENMDAHGGWVSTVADLARFAAAFDAPTACPILSETSISMMFAPPAYLKEGAEWRAGAAYYACGWQVRDYGAGGRNTWHAGSLPGTYSFMARWRSGINCVVLLNRRGPGFEDIDPLLGAVLHAIRKWPADSTRSD